MAPTRERSLRERHNRDGHLGRLERCVLFVRLALIAKPGSLSRFNQPCERPVRCAGWLGGGFSHRHQRKHSLVIGTSYPQGLRLHHPDEFYARQLLASTAKGISPRVSVALLRPFSLTSPNTGPARTRGSAPRLTPCRCAGHLGSSGAWPWIAAVPISPPQQSWCLTSPIAAAGPPRWRQVTATASRCLARRG